MLSRVLSQARYDYVAVGHVSCDVLGGERSGAEVRQPGGTAFYSALQAARLGLRTLIVTQGVPAQIERLLAPYRGEFDLRAIPAAQTTTLATHGGGGARRQRMLAWAGPIVDPLAIDARILHLAPIARETPARWSGDADFIGITPQGLVRVWSDLERVPAAALSGGSAPGEIERVGLERSLLPERFDAAVISAQERPHCRALFAAARQCEGCVAVTAGSRPASLHVFGHGERRVLQSAAPLAVQVRDDLGAGDVFAAAFFVALAEGREPLDAASYANAAAAVRICGDGPGAIGTRAQIERCWTEHSLAACARPPHR